MIQTYYRQEAGYHPFLIREGWQVAQLNYLDGHGFQDIARIEVHAATDEVFILFKGTAVLIAACLGNGNTAFECRKMQPGVTYNMPAGTWHNIAMDRAAEMIIVEKAGTHLGDCAYKALSPQEQTVLYAAIEHELS